MSTFESFFEEYYNNLDKEIKSPRLIIKNKIIKLIYNIFVNADTDLKNSINNFSEKFSVLFIINISTDIEKSCFNATIQISKKAEEPPHRNWDSFPFYDIYSTRSGIICNILNINSDTCKTYGYKLLISLLNNDIKASELGFMTEKELCPESIAFEIAEIQKRSGQKIEEKVSTLFECPFCKQRKCSFTQVQLRSADEAPDYKCKCLNSNCLRRFKGKG